MAHEREELPDEELERLDRFAREDLGNRESNIGTIACARTIHTLIAALRAGANEEAIRSPDLGLLRARRVIVTTLFGSVPHEKQHLLVLLL